jgi:putative ATP-dependent endonuclease of OLD family
LLETAKVFKREKLLSVFVNTYSLEAELVIAGNAALMKRVYLGMHPRSEAKWDAAICKTGDEQAGAVLAIFDDTRKGDFAQLLADEISQDADFVVPKYLSEAIEELVK